LNQHLVGPGDFYNALSYNLRFPYSKKAQFVTVMDIEPNFSGDTIVTHSDKFMRGRVCMVTGAASGIGAITAQTLAQQGATVVMVDYNSERGAIKANQIRQETGNPEVEFIHTDLSVQNEIRKLAQQFNSRYQRLDVLINNAGAMFPLRQETADGLEMTFALNYLAYFLLTNLLLDKLKASAPARIINVSSRAHARAQINLDDLQSRSNYRSRQAYEKSKLAIVLFTYELARRLEGTGVTANTLHPGVVATNFSTNNRGMVGTVMRAIAVNYAGLKTGDTNILSRLSSHLGIISAEQGAQTSIYLATSPDVSGVTGKYFVESKAVSSSQASYDTTIASQLWQVSAAYTGL
jgi:NAD(P)-dependent dehydrogenase (short-subunit alcohol dehydrogenase family)